MEELIIVLTSILLPLIFVVFSVIMYNKKNKKKDIEAKYLQREQELREIREQEKNLNYKNKKPNFGDIIVNLVALGKKMNPDFNVKEITLDLYRGLLQFPDFEGKAELFESINEKLVTPVIERQVQDIIMSFSDRNDNQIPSEGV